MSYKIKIRGIFSTALTHLLLKNDFIITQSSEIIKERFDTQFSESEPDVIIEDGNDKKNLFVFGKKEGISKLLEIIRENFPNSIIRKSQMGKDTIIKGRVLKSIENKNITIFDLGNSQGILEGQTLRNNSNYLVKIDFPDIGRRKAILNSNITLTGLHAVLIYNNPNKISQRITNDNSRKNLYNLARKIKPKNWGILWRTSASEAFEENPDILIEEIDRLQEKSDEIIKNYNNYPAPKILLEGTPIVNIEFPADTRERIDNIRKEIKTTQTLKNHHYYKICSFELGEVIKFSEHVTFNNNSLIEILEQEMERYFGNLYPKLNTMVRITHAKVDGRVFQLTPGNLIEFDLDKKYMKIHRKILGSKKRYYDGLNLTKEEGDYAINSFQLGSWYMKTEYFNRKGDIKGEYWNVSSPIEFFPHPYQIYYLDLEIDLVKLPDGEIVILDEDKLEKAYEEGYISLALKNKSYQLIQEIKTKL
ncbi:MAG: DUF402 domain-containing protein [Candidatus Lokiarchaeota archaeon]|nr:DUF402 domain-containing protein [Candidatus Lokiarchaeota archaeon]